MHCYEFSICQFPRCNLFTQHVIYLLWRDTTSEPMNPGPFFYIDITTYCKHCSLSFSANKHHFPHYTSNPLFSARPVRLTTSLFRWGKVAWLCCVQVPRCCWFPGSAPCQDQPPTPSEVIFFSYWFDKPWFHTEAKLPAALIIPSSWGLPTKMCCHVITN